MGGGTQRQIEAQDRMVSRILGDDIVFKLKVPEKSKLYGIHLRKCEKGRVLGSKAVFYPNEDGVISTQESFAVSGSYSGVDRGGLFWSLLPISADMARALPAWSPEVDKILYRIDIEADGGIIQSHIFEQVFTDPSIAEESLSGELEGAYYSSRTRPGPPLLFLHGSGGLDGAQKRMASALAMKGYGVLALEYSDGRALEEVPLEYFIAGLDWLIERAPGSSGKAIVFGLSKGAEAALLLASMYPERIAAVCAASPSTAVYQGISIDRPPHVGPKSSWTHKGRPLPFLRFICDAPAEKGDLGQHDLFPYYCGIFRDRAEALDKVIDVGSFCGPILLLSGREDRMFPSSAFSDLFMEKNPKADVRHRAWPDAGHVAGWPGYQEIFHFFQGPFLFGGSMKGNGIAARESWMEALRFFERSSALGGSQG